MSAGDPGLDSCGCCEADDLSADIHNRPGLPALAYRIGTHSSFLRRMLAALPGGVLGALTTRAPEDPAIGLLDAWATAADVLAFYQERIANEGYLRTATERRSILELGRAIGYELRPGVAASAFLAFTVEDAVGAPAQARVPTGTKVKSVPGQDERPQTFETVEDIETKAAWNAMPARRSVPQTVSAGQTSLRLAGVTTGLSRGDVLLVVAGSGWQLVRVQAAEPAQGTTVVTMQEPLGLGGPDVQVHAFRLRGALFGHNAPDWRTMAESVQTHFGGPGPDWPGFAVTVLDVDQAHPEILPGSWLVLDEAPTVAAYRVGAATVTARSDFGLAAKVTRIVPEDSDGLSAFGLRATVVHAVSQELALADQPAADSVAGEWIELVPPVAGLAAGRPVVVTGSPAPAEPGDATACEVVVIADVVATGESTRLRLATPLQRAYDPASVRVNANVALATHGETVVEVLGSGAATVPFPRFELKRSPLTYVRSTTATGTRSSLSVRLDEVEWAEAPSTYELGPRSQAYVVRHDDDAVTTVQFGDGRRGSRLPSGQENVRATYRFGLGPDGNVAAGALSLLQTRPLGIRSVTNPVGASGGTAPEARDAARTNAPLTVMTLDRIVSLKDYEDFARAFAGIAKAAAASIWDGRRHLVHLTVAAPGGEAVDPASDLASSLRAAIDANRDPIEEVRVASYQRLTFSVAAKVRVDGRYDVDLTLGRVRAALLATFSFDARAFGQPVTAASVVTAIQAVAGVVACDLDLLYVTPGRPGLIGVLPAAPARPLGTQVVPAQLLVIQPSRLVLRSWQP